MTLPRSKNTNNTQPNRSSTAIISSARPAQPTPKLYEDPAVVEDYNPSKTAYIVNPRKDRPYGQPVKNLHIELSDEDKEKINDTVSFHTVLKLKINGEDWFLKQNVPGSPMSPNEAGISEICKFYIDDLAADAAAVYTMKPDGTGEYYAKASKALPHFKSLVDDPLTDADLKISVLDQKLLTIEQLDEIDEDYARKGIRLENLDKKVLILGRVPVDDLIHYRKVKTLSTILTLNQFAAEDDGHKGNIGNGDFDDDGKAWPVNFKYKESNKLIGKIVQPLDWTWRDPKGKFKVDVKDLDNSPDLVIDQRSIWVNRTDPYGKIIGAMRDVFASFLETDKNAYKKGEEMDRLISLKNHDVYRFHKNKMHLRIILSDPNIFGPLLSLHMKEDYCAEIKGSLCYPHRELNEFFQKRLFEYKRELRKSAQFKAFIEKHGAYAMKVIEGKYAKYNEDLKPFIPNIVPVKELRTRYINSVLELQGSIDEETLLAALKHGNQHILTLVIKMMRANDTEISFYALNQIAKGNPFELSKIYLEKIFELYLKAGKLTPQVAALAKENNLNIVSNAKILNTVGLNRSVPSSPAPEERKRGPSP